MRHVAGVRTVVAPSIRCRFVGCAGVLGCDSLRGEMQRDSPQVFVWATVAMGVLLALLVVHLRTAMAAGGPVAVPDIPAYLGIAQWVGGDGLAPRGIPFQPGYGLLLAPLVAVAQVSQLATQGEAVHYLALIVNSLAATAAVVTAGRLGLVCSGRWWVAGAAGLIAAAHPSLSSASRIAWPETLLTLAVLVVALAVAVAVAAAGSVARRRAWPRAGSSTNKNCTAPSTGSAASRRAWARAGLIATLSVALHARMAVLVVAVVLTALLCRVGRRAWACLGGGLLIGGTATAIALSLTGTWPTDRLSEAAEFDRGSEPILTVAGQVLALGGGTVGLGLIGLVAGLTIAFKLCRRRPFDDADDLTAPGQPADASGGRLGRGTRPERLGGGAHPGLAARSVGERDGNLDVLSAVLLFVALGALGALLLGGWTLTGSDRADALLYGRYVDPWAVPLVVVALAWLVSWQSSRRQASIVLGLSAAVALVACALVVGAADGYDAAPRRIMTLSLSLAWTSLDERLSAVAAVALVVALFGVLLAAIAQRSDAAADTGAPISSAPPSTSDTGGKDARESGGRRGHRADWAVHTGVEDGQTHAATVARAGLGALVAAVVALGAVATVANHRYLADVGDVARNQVVAAEAVSSAIDNDGLTCLAHDRTSVPDYALWLYRLELPEIAHERVRLDADERSCSEFVIASDDLAQRCLNARHLVDEPAGRWALWRLPGRECAVPTV